MNRKYLLDSLDGLKALILRLLPSDMVASVACVPMTTDGPWNDREKAVFEAAMGIPRERTFWTPAGHDNVPRLSEKDARSDWLHHVAGIDCPYLFLDPDTGFYNQPTRHSNKQILVSELEVVLRQRRALMIYRHLYFPKGTVGMDGNAYPYVRHGLKMLQEAGLAAFAYQSQAASCFFISKRTKEITPFRKGLRQRLSGTIVDERLITQ